jgi:hypothetical protein
MGFAKIYDSILDSSLWQDHDATRIFQTALLMAKPHELREPTPTIRIGSLEPGDYIVPPGWYGMVPAASVGIIKRAMIPEEQGMRALEVLAAPDMHSRSDEHDGRRLVRINGGFVVLNLMKYRDRDETNAERQKRFRKREKPKKKKGVTGRNGVTERYVTGSNAIQRSEVRGQRSEAEAGSEGAPARLVAFKKGERWLSLYRQHWGAAKGRQHPPDERDRGAAEKLSTFLRGLSAAELDPAVANADQIIRVFLAKDHASLVKADHPFAWFVQDFNALRLTVADRGDVGSAR